MANWTTTGYELFNATALPATATFLIVPDEGYSLSASNFDFTDLDGSIQAQTGVVDITFSDTAIANTPSNNVIGTIQFDSGFNLNSDISQIINLSVVEQYNSTNFKTLLNIQSNGNNGFTTGSSVYISSNPDYTGAETTISDSSTWQVSQANGSYIANNINIGIPLDSYVNFIEIIISADQGHYFADSTENVEFLLEDSTISLELPGFGDGNQVINTTEEYIDEELWEISRVLEMQPVNDVSIIPSQSESPQMVCTAIKFIINYNSPVIASLFDYNNNNLFDQDFSIQISIPGVVPRTLSFQDMGPITFTGGDAVNSFSLPLNNTVLSYTITESGDDASTMFVPDPTGFVENVMLNISENDTGSARSGVLTVTANSGAVNNSPATTSDSITIVQSAVPSINALAKFQDQDDTSYVSGLNSTNHLGGPIVIKIETDIPFGNDFTAAEALSSVQVINVTSGQYVTVPNGNSEAFLDEEGLLAMQSEVQAGASVEQLNNYSAIVIVTIPQNTVSISRAFRFTFSHPQHADVTSSVEILQTAGYSPLDSGNLNFYVATSYNEVNYPTAFEQIDSSFPDNINAKNLISNDGGGIIFYARVAEANLSADIIQNISNLFVLVNDSPIGVVGNKYFLSPGGNEVGYAHFQNLQADYYSYDPSTQTGGPVNVRLVFVAPENDYFQGDSFVQFLAQLTTGTPKPAQMFVQGFNPLNPYFDPNSTETPVPDDVIKFKQRQANYIKFVEGHSHGQVINIEEPTIEMSDTFDMEFYDEDTGTAKVEILQYKNILVDEDGIPYLNPTWQTVAANGAPSWVAFDANFTTTEIVSDTTSGLFSPSTFEPTLYYSPSVYGIGRQVKLGFTTGLASFDDNNDGDLNKKLLTLEFAEGLPDYVTLKNISFDGGPALAMNVFDINNQEFPSFVQNFYQGAIGGRHAEHFIGPNQPSSSPHFDGWSGDKTFTFNYKVNAAYGSDLRIYGYTILPLENNIDFEAPSDNDGTLATSESIWPVFIPNNFPEGVEGIGYNGFNGYLVNGPGPILNPDEDLISFFNEGGISVGDSIGIKRPLVSSISLGSSFIDSDGDTIVPLNLTLNGNYNKTIAPNYNRYHIVITVARNSYQDGMTIVPISGDSTIEGLNPALTSAPGRVAETLSLFLHLNEGNI